MNTIHTTELCSLDELPEGEARGFSQADINSEVDIFIVNKNSHIYGYVNSCPHTGAPLEWMPNQFLSLDRDSIQCSLHGARFTINDGHCIQGPCNGQGLAPIKITVENNMIYWQSQ